MTTIKTLAVLVVLAALAGVGFVYSGLYNIGADSPHWPTTFALVETLRERSIAARAAGIEVPVDLDDRARVRSGAGNYDAMCVACHLKPGQDESEIRRGLYPQPPNLASPEAAAASDPASQFWVIKHGIKLTAMPAWSKAGVDDGTIWDMVAVLQELPTLSAQEFDALVEASEGHSHAQGHDHDH
jgi:mono/diheme cytochrome c family protein